MAELLETVENQFSTFLGVTEYAKESKIGEDEYKSFKSSVISNAPKFGAFELKNMVFRPDGRVDYQTNEGKIFMPIAKNSQDKIMSALGLNDVGINKVSKETRAQVLGKLKSEKSSNFNFTMTSEGIIDLTNKSISPMKISSSFSVLEKFIQLYNMDIDSMKFDEGKGTYTVNLRTKTEVKAIDLFKTGISFDYSRDGIDISQFYLRLVCTNGMVRKMKTETVRFDECNRDGVERFYDTISKMAENGFRSESFEKRWCLANVNKASLREAYKTFTVLDKVAPDFLKDKPFEFLQNFRAKGINLNDKDSAFYRTPITVAQCVNFLTDAASHTEGLGVIQLNELQYLSSYLLGNRSDEYLIKKQLYEI